VAGALSLAGGFLSCAMHFHHRRDGGFLTAKKERGEALGNPTNIAEAGPLYFFSCRSCGHKPPYAVDHYLGLVGLGKSPFLAQIRSGAGCTRNTSGQNHIKARAVCTHPLGQSKAVHRARHLYVAEDDVDGDVGVLKDDQGFFCIRCLP